MDRYRTVIVNSECRHVPILREGYGASITDYCALCTFKFPPVCVTIKKAVDPSLRQSVLIIDMSVSEKETFSIIHQQGIIGQDGKVKQHLVHLRITVSTDGDSLAGHRIEAFCDPLRIQSLGYPVAGTIIQDISQNAKHSALLLSVKCQHLFQCR